MIEITPFDDFERLTGRKPYPHQIETIDALRKGKSVLLRAPTGSGKSEAVFVPFVSNRGKTLPNQMIYSLPLRTLVEDLAERFKGYAQDPSLSVSLHHGGKAFSPLFYPDAVVTTIDQTVGAYCCTPLSLPIRHGNIPAGAVANSFLVFDEVHTFEPLLGLQSALILAYHSRNLGFPFAFMSATMPDCFVRHMQKKFSAEPIEAKEKDILVRQNREVFLHLHKDHHITGAEVKAQWEKSQGKMIVVCNKVDRAQKLFRETKDLLGSQGIILLHSRFLGKDREEKQKRLQGIFDPKSDKTGILIATQVIEVGLDISCDTMLTEVSPVDSIIQRAGRCARRGKENEKIKGNLHVYDVEDHHPYDEELLKKTLQALQHVDRRRLDWDLELSLVNDVLSDEFNEYLKIENTAKILNQLSEGAFTGNRKQVEESVRKVFSCQVSIHDNPSSVQNKIFSLPKINLPVGLLRKLLKGRPEGTNAPVWEIQIDQNRVKDEKPSVIFKQMTSSNSIYPNVFYVVHPTLACYDPESGLLLDRVGLSFSAETNLAEEPETGRFGSITRETWVEHSQKVLSVFRQRLLPYYEFTLKKLAKAWNCRFRDLVDKIEFSLAIHDLGKLNIDWQKAIGVKRGEVPLAHSGQDLKLNLPPHATISAYVFYDLFYKWGIIGDAMKYAIAHHHSVRAKEVPKFKLIPGWQEQLSNALKGNHCGSEVNVSIEKQESSTTVDKFPDFANDKLYRTYTIVSRILRLSDWIATGGDDAILYFEKWYAGI